VKVGVLRESIETVGSLNEEQEVLQDPFGVVSPENGVNTGTSWEGLTGPPPVEEDSPAAAAAEVVERGEEDSAAFKDKVPLGLPKGGTSVNLTDYSGF